MAKSDKETFEYKGRKFELLVKKINFPHIGLRTDVEIPNDEAAMKFLVEGKSELIREIK